MVGQDRQEAPDVRLQVLLGDLLQGNEDGDRVTVNLHFWLGEQVQVVGIQVGALVSRADAETHSPLAQLPTDPLGAERERVYSALLNSSPQSSFARQHRPQEGLAPLTKLRELPRRIKDLQEFRDIKHSSFLIRDL